MNDGLSAFGVDHGGVSKRDDERAKHYGRMAAATGTLGGTAAAVGAGAGAIGLAESKGHDPVGFLPQRSARHKPASHAVKMRVLKPLSRDHGRQAAVLGGLSAGTLAISGAYKHKQNKALAKRDLGRKATDAGLAAGTTGAAGATGYYGVRQGKVYAQGAYAGGKTASYAHHDIRSAKQGRYKATAAHLAHLKSTRNTGLRMAATKGAGAVGTGVAGAAGAAGLFELGRNAARKRKPS
jgi:hypothetical protein